VQKFRVLRAVAAPFPFAHVDTDRIIPARHMTTVSKRGLGQHLFAGERYDGAGNERPGFVLNREPWRRAGVLIAYENFGCGSSREHAAWALTDFGVRCVVAPSFGDIFRANCLKNGLLPLAVPLAVCERLVAEAAVPGAVMTIDLERQVIGLAGGEEIGFLIDRHEREALLTGADQVDKTLRHEALIDAYEVRPAR